VPIKFLHRDTSEAILRLLREAELQARMIHRDIKPANIILEPTASGGWHPFVVDLGLARALDSNPLTCGPSILGTPAYMPREQS
jgi:serine/threonine-protein kinase